MHILYVKDVLLAEYSLMEIWFVWIPVPNLPQRHNRYYVTLNTNTAYVSSFNVNLKSINITKTLYTFLYMYENVYKNALRYPPTESNASLRINLNLLDVMAI